MMMRTGYLETLTGPLQGQKHTFRSQLTIGRRSDNTVRLIDAKVSRNHAKILATDEGFCIEDMQSSNGTFVNGENVESCLLRHGDTITIGFTELRFSEREIGKSEIKDHLSTIATERRMPDLNQTQIAGQFPATGGDDLNLQRLQAIMRLNRAIGGDLDLEMMLEKILEEFFLIFGPERGAVLALNENTGELDFVCSRAKHGGNGLDSSLLSRSILNKVLEHSVGILVDDATMDDRFSLSESVSLDKIRSGLCVPLIRQNEVIGVIFTEGSPYPWSEQPTRQLSGLSSSPFISSYSCFQNDSHDIDIFDSSFVKFYWIVSKFKIPFFPGRNFQDRLPYLVPDQLFKIILIDIGKIKENLTHASAGFLCFH